MRSFSSVISSMLGQHPQAYGLPELNLFLADTLGKVIQMLESKRPQGLNGLLRTVAELEYHEQTEETIRRARAWLTQRRHWSIRQVFEHVGRQIGERVLVEKSPSTVLDESRLVRLQRNFPEAFYLHLTRHPRSTCKSIYEIQQKTAILGKRKPSTQTNSESLWLRTNLNILHFTAKLPPGQTLCLQGELLLSQPELYLPQIAEWLGFRTDAEAIEAMKHPENSPYARLGPPNAPFGHDPNFLYNPSFEKRPTRSEHLEGPFEWSASGNNRFSHATLKTARTLGYQ